MNPLSVFGLINVAPSAATLPTGVIVFPVPELQAWLVIGGLLAICCTVLGLLSVRWPVRRQRIARPRRLRPAGPQPQQL